MSDRHQLQQQLQLWLQALDDALNTSELPALHVRATDDDSDGNTYLEIECPLTGDIVDSFLIPEPTWASVAEVKELTIAALVAKGVHALPGEVTLFEDARN